MKNSLSGSCVEASLGATLCEGVCTAASRKSGGTGREHVGQRTSCVEGGANDSSKRKLRRNVLSLRGGIQKWGGDGVAGTAGSINKNATLQECKKRELRGSLGGRG